MFLFLCFIYLIISTQTHSIDYDQPGIYQIDKSIYGDADNLIVKLWGVYGGDGAGGMIRVIV